ncbi:RNA pyrophosphohydrolase [bioreactor metagenome]|uniref:RNA pyrophosphohydrolase n=1 Tax=bioreactor metagenome TaxID=1076179 RepID=A0A645FB91_9ZZZZ
MGKKFQLCGASVIIYKDNKVLLQQRKDNKCWGYHGGSVEMGEKVEDAARRELLEETGLIANRLELYGVFSGSEQYHMYPDGNEAYIIDIVYLCNDFMGDVHIQESEVLQLKWFDFDKIPEKLSPPIKSVLIKFCNEKIMQLSKQ